MITRASRICIVREQIAEGYGVEDIAVRFNIPLQWVRSDVEILRKSGDLKYMFGGVE